jgi:hypothetical protein
LSILLSITGRNSFWEAPQAMINPDELYELYGDFLAGAEFEFEDEKTCMDWCFTNDHFLKWLAEENIIRARRDKGGAGSFEHFRRLMSAEVC